MSGRRRKNEVRRVPSIWRFNVSTIEAPAPPLALVRRAEEDAAGEERRVEAEEAAIDVERDGADHPEDARDPGAHALAEAREAVRQEHEAADDRDLGGREARLEARHLAVGDRAGLREGALGIGGRRAQRGREHREERGRIFAPPRGGELGLADGAIAVRHEEALDRGARLGGGGPRRRVGSI